MKRILIIDQNQDKPIVLDVTEDSISFDGVQTLANAFNSLPMDIKRIQTRGNRFNREASSVSIVWAEVDKPAPGRVSESFDFESALLTMVCARKPYGPNDTRMERVRKIRKLTGCNVDQALVLINKIEGENS